MQVLPVDPGPKVVHHSLLDLLLDPLVRLSLQLQRLVVVLPLFGFKKKKKREKWNSTKTKYSLGLSKSLMKGNSPSQSRRGTFSGLLWPEPAGSGWLYLGFLCSDCTRSTRCRGSSSHQDTSSRNLAEQKKNRLLTMGFKIYRDNGLCLFLSLPKKRTTTDQLARG